MPTTANRTQTIVSGPRGHADEVINFVQQTLATRSCWTQAR